MTTAPPPRTETHVHLFGRSRTEGGVGQKELLGGKGANLAEMCRIGIPVPPGFTIDTRACTLHGEVGREELRRRLEGDVRRGIAFVEQELGKRFGEPDDPLLLSVRSGARASMPGMMDTILNLGLDDTAVAGLARRSGDERFAWDSYRRFVQMYGDVVMGLKPASKEDHDPFEVVLDALKAERGVSLDTELDASALKELVARFKALVRARVGRDFPTDPWEQLWGAIFAVFESWDNERARVYRELNDIPASWGTAVNVQAMVFGNLGDTSATGVAFTRDAATGEAMFNGEFLVNAQGEDVVAGIRTPQQITLVGSRRWAELAGVDEATRKAQHPSLEELMPQLYGELFAAQERLEEHFKDMQDLEFTIQEGQLWLLQTRNGKRTGAAMVRIAMELLAEGRIDELTALQRIDAERLDELLHPVFDEQQITETPLIARGLPASPGAASGRIAFFADDAEDRAKAGEEIILVRHETSPEDLRGMAAARGILTARGGMTSHAAVVARGMGKCCISGAGALHIDLRARTLTIEGRVFRESDWLSLDGSTGTVHAGRVPTREAELTGDFGRLMALADRHRRLGVRANADTPRDAEVAQRFGAAGIGLARTEHMFFEGDRIRYVREMILADDDAGRRRALAKLLPIQREDFEGLFTAMSGLPVTIRLLDPPLHEFLPQDEAGQRAVAEGLGVPTARIALHVEDLREQNPMMGHRGCRLGITHPEVTEMQARAILEAALLARNKGADPRVEIMVPLVGTVRELEAQRAVIDRVAEQVFAEHGERIEYHVGTMIETPRGALVADSIATRAEFFSLGTNDLTQLTLGFSRDDIGSFLPQYLARGIYERDPFQSLDQRGVGQLVDMTVKKGRGTRPNLSIGVCGEHGGDPRSIGFFHRAGLDYVSCSPYRVPIARVAAAQAALQE